MNFAISLPNFWLGFLLLPWIYYQRFLSGFAPEPEYRMPSEWSPHRRTLMAWPDRTSVDSTDELYRAWSEVADVANTIAKYEPVWLYCSGQNFLAARDYVFPNVTIKEVNVEHLWMRDTGPLLTRDGDGKLSGVDLNFNYWGAKVSYPFSFDTKIAAHILEDQRIPQRTAPFISEGGALDVDGERTLLATESSLLNTNRNPAFSKKTLESQLHSLLGTTKVIWLPGAKGLDITDGHISTLARFAPNGTVLLSRPNSAVPAHDASWRVFEQSQTILRSASNAAGRPLRIVEVEEALTVPYTRVAGSHKPPATSYLNSYLANGAVVMPLFEEEKTDSEAIQVMKKVWPNREVVGVKLDILPWLGGGVHRATMQWPLGLEEGDKRTIEL